MSTYLLTVGPEPGGLIYEDDESLRLARVICTQLMMPIVCVIGVATNALNIVVLTTATMRSSTSCYLCAVAFYDLLYSLTGLPLALRTFAFLEKSATFMHALKYLLSFGNMWSNTAACLTCTFTIERFMAISTPIRSRKNFTIRRTQLSILIVCLITALLTLPDFFERKIGEAKGSCYNETLRLDLKATHICGETFYVFEPTWMSEQMNRFGLSYARAVLFVFIPLIILTIFNALLIKSVVRAHHARSSMLADPTARHRKSKKVKRHEHAHWRQEPVGSLDTRLRKELLWRKWWLTRRFSQKRTSTDHISSVSNCNPKQAELSVEPMVLDTSNPNIELLDRKSIEPKTIAHLTNEIPHVDRPKRQFLFCLTRYSSRVHKDSFLRRSSYQDKQAITITLIAVVVVFCVLTTPSAILHIMSTWAVVSEARLKIFGNISNLLLMLNSALNFFLYSLFSARFRLSFRNLVMRRCR